MQERHFALRDFEQGVCATHFLERFGVTAGQLGRQ
jgi:hypothetical protein